MALKCGKVVIFATILAFGVLINGMGVIIFLVDWRFGKAKVL